MQELLEASVLRLRHREIYSPQWLPTQVGACWVQLPGENKWRFQGNSEAWTLELLTSRFTQGQAQAAETILPAPLSRPHQRDRPKYWFPERISRLSNPFAILLRMGAFSTLLLLTTVQRGQTDLSADRSAKRLFGDRRPSDFCPRLKGVRIERHSYWGVPSSPCCLFLSTSFFYLTSTKIRMEMMVNLVSF